MRNIFERAFKESFITKKKRRINEDVLTDELKDNMEKNVKSPVPDKETLKDAGVRNTDVITDEYVKNSVFQDDELNKQIAQRNEEIKNIMTDWIDKISEFANFLNDPMTDTSIRCMIENATPGTPLAQLEQADLKKLTKMASELTGFAETLKSKINYKMETEA